MEMMRGDILKVKRGIICHQVNCKGVMGAGLAKDLKERYPSAYEDYMSAYKRGELELGNAIFSVIRNKDLYIAHICGQRDYGREKGKVYTSFLGVMESLRSVTKFSKRVNLPIYVPFKMGCGLAGGNWQSMMKVINQINPDCIIVMKQEP
jgi:O-acetyl-ADP-ribose deacetylase (regulator of RNase III)